MKHGKELSQEAPQLRRRLPARSGSALLALTLGACGAMGPGPKPDNSRGPAPTPCATAELSRPFDLGRPLSLVIDGDRLQRLENGDAQALAGTVQEARDMLKEEDRGTRHDASYAAVARLNIAGLEHTNAGAMEAAQTRAKRLANTLRGALCLYDPAPQFHDVGLPGGDRTDLMFVMREIGSRESSAPPASPSAPPPIVAG